MNSIGRTLFDDGTLLSDFVSFQYGAPGKDLMPSEVLSSASSAFFEDMEHNFTYLQYGPTLGTHEFLSSLQKFLQKSYKDPMLQMSCLALSAGASQSFSNILTLFTTAQTQIIIENPTYFLAIKVLEDHGFDRNRFWTIETDSDGLDVDQLESRLEEKLGREVPQPATDHRFPFLLYLVPTYSNPTGRSTSLERRKRLIEIARKYNVLVVCDDVYQLLPFEDAQPPPTRLVELDRLGGSGFGNVISNNSFSKILAPGLRLGWIESNPRLIEFLGKCGLMNSGGSPNHIVSGLVWTAIEQGGLESHVARLKAEYQRRMHAMCDYLAKNLPEGVKFERPLGGFFIWIVLPKGHDAFEIQEANLKGGLYHGKRLSKQKVAFAPGRNFSVGTNVENCLRLSFAYYKLDELIEGCERLCVLLKDALASEL